MSACEEMLDKWNRRARGTENGIFKNQIIYLVRKYKNFKRTRTKEDAFNNPDAIELLKAVEQVPQRTTEQTTTDDDMLVRNIRGREDDVETVHQEQRRDGVEQEEQLAEISTTRRTSHYKKEKKENMRYPRVPHIV